MSAAEIHDEMTIEEFVELMVEKSEKDAAHDMWLSVLRDQEGVANVGELRERVPTLSAIDGLSIFAQAYICDLLDVALPGGEDESKNKRVKMGFTDRLSNAVKELYTNVEVVMVEAIAGKELAPKDFFSGLSDPYLLFGLVDNEDEEFNWPQGLGQQYFQTRLIRKSLNPQWNCVPIEFVKKVASSGELAKKFLRIECWDHNIAMRHDFMGVALFPVERIDRISPGMSIDPRWLILESRKGRQDVVSGAVQLRMSYLDLDGYNALISCLAGEGVRNSWHALRASIDIAQASYLGVKYAGIPEMRCKPEDLEPGHVPTLFARRRSLVGDSCSSGVDIVNDDEGEVVVVVSDEHRAAVSGAASSDATPGRASEERLRALVVPSGGGFYAIARFDNFISQLKDADEERFLGEPLRRARPFVVDVTGTLRLQNCKVNARWTPPTDDDLEPPEIARCVACVVEHKVQAGRSLRYDLVVFDYQFMMVAHLHTKRDAVGTHVWLPRAHVKFFSVHSFDGNYDQTLRDPSYTIMPVDVEKLKKRSLFACCLTDIAMLEESIVPV